MCQPGMLRRPLRSWEILKGSEWFEGENPRDGTIHTVGNAHKIPTNTYKINEKWLEIDVTHVNQWLLLSDFAALSASTWNCEKVSLQCNIRTSTRQAATPCGVQLVKATCKPGAARILLQDRYFGMLQDDARYVTQQWAIKKYVS